MNALALDAKERSEGAVELGAGLGDLLGHPVERPNLPPSGYPYLRLQNSASANPHDSLAPLGCAYVFISDLDRATGEANSKGGDPGPRGADAPVALGSRGGAPVLPVCCRIRQNRRKGGRQGPGQSPRLALRHNARRNWAKPRRSGRV